MHACMHIRISYNIIEGKSIKTKMDKSNTDTPLTLDRIKESDESKSLEC